jgi:hypothetical protein
MLQNKETDSIYLYGLYYALHSINIQTLLVRAWYFLYSLNARATFQLGGSLWGESDSRSQINLSERQTKVFSVLN